MSLLTARSFLAEYAPDLKIIELEDNATSVQQAADIHGVEPGQIARSLVYKIGENPLMIVVSGDAQIDNTRFKDVFGGEATLLDDETVMELTSHPAGGVCPFGLTADLPVYCDKSLQHFDEVLPAAGSPDSAVRVCPSRLAELVKAEWVDVCSPADAS
ncbi:YbaK/EbsC family protein [Vreelandella populi]|uniref:YbaK/EbsC family protein n=1 Tax=Vreelandella populi TaxID=2498858 RepID=A0A3S0YKI3_9GAMM|nr:YbaK/EbsC family protein [Halomonas populi]RUR35351.1 YbaK/EbsC family protein [Halomonas populi]RUR47542.1 YbaK/EbsC family protein [Halomonas populi]